MAMSAGYRLDVFDFELTDEQRAVLNDTAVRVYGL
jgi:hypothetical protein